MKIMSMTRETYQIEEDARTVTVLIRGRESVVQNRSDLVVYANLSEIQDINTTSTYVPVTFGKSAESLWRMWRSSRK